MTPKEFIKKWNVAFESKEQELEFAVEMESDLMSVKLKRYNKQTIQEWLDFNGLEDLTSSDGVRYYDETTLINLLIQIQS